MDLYVQSLFIAIPLFSLLIIIEMIFAKIKKIDINHSADMISSLSSGLTNTTKDAIKFSFVIISYSWFVDKLTIYEIKPLWLAVLAAFIIQDFAGYWIHRLTHRVNILWNRHVIHHSSEEFNLSCALRQPISETFKFFAFLWIPAALLGIPVKIFAIVAPVHLFLQFWYHTRLINKMGILEHILVTPSHHRVHHGINPEYLDKNYSQIFIVWDKIFGTFQPEIDSIKPVYGTLRPAKTWNPIIINFKHMIQLIKDAWHAEKIIDKLRIWFMPTGWRPDNVLEKHPLNQIKNPYSQLKYNRKNSQTLLLWTWLQFLIAAFFMFHLFIIMSNYSALMYYLYAIFLFTHIFSFTSTLDHKFHAIIADSLKLILASGIIYYQNYSWFGLNTAFAIILIIYCIISTATTSYFYKLNKLTI
tara:strand:- start:1239 stop:2483 length:1245 start_codon:yes stop_codon:yes gene_type:complete